MCDDERNDRYTQRQIETAGQTGPARDWSQTQVDIKEIHTDTGNKKIFQLFIHCDINRHHGSYINILVPGIDYGGMIGFSWYMIDMIMS